MSFTNPRFASELGTIVVAENAAGETVFIPTDQENADYRLITEGDEELAIEPVAIAAYKKPGRK